jgi:putative ATP-binding cassette transporter
MKLSSSAELLRGCLGRLRAGFVGAADRGAMGAGPSGSDSPADATLSRKRDARRRLFRFVDLAMGFWSGDDARRAWRLTAVVAACVALQLAAQVGLNVWSRSFFDALDHRSAEAVARNAFILPFLALCSGLSVSAALVSKMTMQLRWREWLARKIAGWWIEDQRYYRLNVANAALTAPESRISDDVRLAIEPLVDFAIGFLTAAVTATTFVGILWNVGGSAHIPLAGSVIVVPGYLGFAALAYTATTSGLAYFAGRSLMRAVAQKNDWEARFRAELTRLRENAESIALIRGDEDEYKSAIAGLSHVVDAWRHMIEQNGFIATVQSTNGALVPLFPLILVAPKYLDGQLTLGAVMQIASAFVAVQVALNWFVDNFVRVAEWMASAARVDELTDALEGLDVSVIMEDGKGIEIVQNDDDKIRLVNLSVAHRNGRVVIADADVEIAAGEKVLIGGASGSGKSTLIRALAGLWPWGSGRILLPRGASLAFAPQRAYIPLGTLRNALLYSAGSTEITDDMIHGAMRRCGLRHLIPRLDDDARWDQTLSGGERQRIAFARILLQRPQIIIMDEATSALDEDGQASLLHLLNEDLAYATVVSVGHRPALEDFHDRKLWLERKPAGSTVSSRKLQKSLWHIFETGHKGC